MKTIVIDPGHGGEDPGAVSGGRREKDDNLRLGLLVAQKLRDCGQNVIMTRSTDVFIPLLTRAQTSNSNNADLFISLHRNAFSNPQANGVENYVQTGASARSWEYAANVLNDIVNVGVQSNRGVKSANFSVLRNTRAPAMLIEMGFITNDADNTLFDRHLDEYAQAVVNGALRSLGESCATAPPSGSGGNQTMRSIQQTLNNRYGAGLAVDGIYGPATKRALVRGLQTELNNTYGAGLSVDGIFGPRTKAAIRNVRRGDRGNIVWLLQAMLFANGYNIGVDGIFGANTEVAVRQFQARNGLSPDGIAGRNTFEALFT